MLTSKKTRKKSSAPKRAVTPKELRPTEHGDNLVDQVRKDVYGGVGALSPSDVCNLLDEVIFRLQHHRSSVKRTLRKVLIEARGQLWNEFPEMEVR